MTGGVILTRGDGTPIDCPEPPPQNATTEEKIAYLRAKWAAEDDVSDVANRAFAEVFAKGLKR